MQTFAALPSTGLLHRDFEAKETSYAPILGWTYIQSGQVFPLLPIPHHGMTHGKAYEFEDGTVYDPIHRRRFRDLAKWEDYIDEADVPKHEIALPEKLAQISKAVVTADDAEEVLNAARTEARTHEPKVGLEDIVWGAKTYKTNSFWCVPDQFVFIVPGGETYPKEGADKVKRTEFDALKRGDSGLPEMDYAEVCRQVMGEGLGGPDDDDQDIDDDILEEDGESRDVSSDDEDMLDLDDLL